MVQIAPSILSANLARLADDVEAVMTAGADRIHFDVMDNHYVPNLTFGSGLCQSLRKAGCTAPIDVHLMTRPVDDLIHQFAKAGADSICFHPEASDHVHRSLSHIREHGLPAGLALNPATPWQWLEPVADLLDFVLIMSVNPGFGGQRFLESSLAKIRTIRRHYPTLAIEVDGGVNADNIGKIVAAGAHGVVAGSAVFGQDDYAQAIKALRQGCA